MPHYLLNSLEVAQYQRDGFVIVRGLFERDEMFKLLSHAKGDEALTQSVYGRKDSSGQVTKLALQNEAGDDLYGMFARSPRMLDRVEQLLGEEVYLWHSKMMLKEPLVGGAWEWHQDYGYWYFDGCLTPDLLSVLISIDHAHKANGCLQVIRGSHLIGRIDHGKTVDQSGADLSRVQQALDRMELVWCECEPGDAIFFHSNVLHRSDQNTSPNARWSLICCYNTKSNSPLTVRKHPRYTPLDRVTDDAIRAWQPLHHS